MGVDSIKLGLVHKQMTEIAPRSSDSSGFSAATHIRRQHSSDTDDLVSIVFSPPYDEPVSADDDYPHSVSRDSYNNNYNYHNGDHNNDNSIGLEGVPSALPRAVSDNFNLGAGAPPPAATNARSSSISGAAAARSPSPFFASRSVSGLRRRQRQLQMEARQQQAQQQKLLPKSDYGVLTSDANVVVADLHPPQQPIAVGGDEHSDARAFVDSSATTSSRTADAVSSTGITAAAAEMLNATEAAAVTISRASIFDVGTATTPVEFMSGATTAAAGPISTTSASSSSSSSSIRSSVSTALEVEAAGSSSSAPPLPLSARPHPRPPPALRLHESNNAPATALKERSSVATVLKERAAGGPRRVAFSSLLRVFPVSPVKVDETPGPRAAAHAPTGGRAQYHSQDEEALMRPVESAAAGAAAVAVNSAASSSSRRTLAMRSPRSLPMRVMPITTAASAALQRGLRRLSASSETV